MAFPTLNTQVVLESYLFVVKVAGTVLGQARNFQTQAQSTTRQHPRIGDIEQARTAGPKSNSITIELYTDHDYLEVARILNQYPAGGVWLGTEELTLDPSVAALDLTVEQYDTTGATATLKATETIESFVANSMSRDVTADAAVMFSIQGTCNRTFITPVAT